MEQEVERYGCAIIVQQGTMDSNLRESGISSGSRETRSTTGQPRKVITGLVAAASNCVAQLGMRRINCDLAPARCMCHTRWELASRCRSGGSYCLDTGVCEMALAVNKIGRGKP